MKAFAITGPGTIRSVEVPEPIVGPEDVLLKIRYIGLCGTDINTFRGNNVLAQFPRIPGHEISAEIIGKGPGVPGSIRIGETVTVSPYSHCGVCPACRQGRFNTCEYNETLGVQRDGALMERFAVPFTKIAQSALLSLQELTLVEPLSVGYHAANRAAVTEQDTVLVIGCGAVGLGAVCAAVRKGAVVITADVDDKKLQVARTYGAAHVINTSAEDAEAVIRSLTRGEGVSVVIEAAGNEKTQRLALSAVAFAGRVAMIGYAKGEVTLDTRLIVKKELTVTGSRNALRVFPQVIAMLEKREKPYLELITTVYPFERTPEAFADWNANPDRFSKILIEVSAP